MIKDIVENLMKKYNTNCPFTLAKKLNVTIRYENLGNTMGYFTKDFRIKFIHINQQLEEAESIFTCAHELGHVIQHPNVNTPFLKRYTLFSTSKIEREANTFAVEFLLPDKLLREYSECTLSTIAKRYGIPEKLLCLKKTEPNFF
ncbi:Zn-dependent peptidase ImmA (M78 family) [Sporomusaceae bacterium BoRhaA]|uniref:ImmA/IrrE family metallo-endopeptidase n=1 Tax=Pelorhabdus rhamnosifermentans TaxID=2772457 RepID=UPI001C060A5F|nr:ImmA/IrrE family metallo-endopeptidase [Pelorhabdus rhamnosifermentans]MBU2703597.1 Zn-dependent peptidase ImmA (M78 family) [Pelorhabdus rhamnosifermentans]